MLACAAAALSMHGTVRAEYPERAVRMVVGSSPGDPNDILARLVAVPLRRYFKQPFVVENYAGAMGNIAAARVAKTEPDGHTLLVVSTSFATSVAMYPRLAYHPQRDFAPVARIGTLHHVLVVNSDLHVRTLPDFYRYLRARPGQIAIASAGTGSTSHLAAELMKIHGGWLNALHVPYRGNAHALADVLGNYVQAMFASVRSAHAHVKSGRLNALAVTGEKRSAALRGVPTFSEAGLPGLENAAWSGIVAPAGTPYDTIVRLSVALREVLKTPVIQQRFETQGAETVNGTPEGFADFLHEEIAKWGKVVKAADISLQ